MPFIKVYIHFVWSTKSRYPYLHTSELRKAMWNHIRENAKKKDIYIDFINGYEEHCHCLVSLGDNQTLRQIMQLIKSESSYWVNKEQLLKEKFEWQDEYFAVSVSESHIDKVRNYIKNQEDHHSRKKWENEYDELIEKYGFQKFTDQE
jgi:putative transposase